MTIWHKRFACWITKATNIHSEYVILTAVALHLWLHDRASMLSYTYIACLLKASSFPCVLPTPPISTSTSPSLHLKRRSSYIRKMIFKQFYRSFCYINFLKYSITLSNLSKITLDYYPFCRARYLVSRPHDSRC
jgi:hypothetical protein